MNTIYDRIAARLTAAGYSAQATVGHAAWITVRIGTTAFVVGDNVDTWGADFYPTQNALESGEPEIGFSTTIARASTDDAAIVAEVIRQIVAFRQRRYGFVRMFLVQHDYEGAWLDARREDLCDCDLTGTAGQDVAALFYTEAEARAYVDAMCGLIHMGGNPDRFRIVPVEFDGDRIVRAGA